jgi:tetratricopeptide (TPR) repeat protein
MLRDMGDERLTRATELYEQAVFVGNTDALGDADTLLDAVEADLALARGRILHARFLDDRSEDPHELAHFERAVALYHRLGNVPGEAEAYFWVGCYHQVIRGDGAAALPALQRSYALAADPVTRSYAIRHLGFHALEQGRLDLARQRFEESLALRREAGYRLGIGAAILALAELATVEEDLDRARDLLDEAATEAREAGAYGTLHWIDEARSQLG